MYSLAFLVTACLVTAALTTAACLLLARRRLAQARAAEQQHSRQALLALREIHIRELREAQASLARDIADLQARGRRPLRTLMDSLLN